MGGVPVRPEALEAAAMAIAAVDDRLPWPRIIEKDRDWYRGLADAAIQAFLALGGRSMPEQLFGERIDAGVLASLRFERGQALARAVAAEAERDALRDVLRAITRTRDGHDAVECQTYQCPACLAEAALAASISKEETRDAG
jgi:hypothetical protein